MCEIVRELELEKNNTKCFGVDHWCGDEHAGLIDAKEAYVFVNRINQEYGDFSKLVKKTFNDAKKNFDDHSIDFIHFDGRHYYEDIKEDFSKVIRFDKDHEKFEIKTALNLNPDIIIIMIVERNFFDYDFIVSGLGVALENF